MVSDKFAKKHLKRVKKGAKSVKAVKKRWLNEIEPLIPCGIFSQPQIPLWTARFFFNSVSLPCLSGDLIKTSGYALLDFTIYSFFEIRRTLVCGIKRSVVEQMDDLYLSYVVKYFSKYFRFTEGEINNIIDNRLARYEEIIMTTDIDTNDELLLSACDFLKNDFSKNPIQNQSLSVGSAHTHFLLCSELASLIRGLRSTLKDIRNQLPSDCFF